MAAAIAFPTAGATAMIPGSPTPLAPNGPVGSASSMMNVSMCSGTSGAPDLVIHHGRIGEAAAVPHQFLAQRVAEALHEAALELPFHRLGVDGAADIMGEPRRDWHNSAGHLVDFDLHHLGAK